MSETHHRADRKALEINEEISRRLDAFLPNLRISKAAKVAILLKTVEEQESQISWLKSLVEMAAKR